MQMLLWVKADVEVTFARIDNAASISWGAQKK